MNVVKRFRILQPNEHFLAQNIRTFLTEKLHLYRETAIFRKNGGRSGDLAEEIMEYEIFIAGSEGGRNDGFVALYSVTDNSVNGKAQILSIVAALLEKSHSHAALLDFLDSQQFVSSYASFKERPFGWHSFRSYLDDAPNLNSIHTQFMYKSH